MACSSVAAAISFWLARGGVFGVLTSKSVLMRSRACVPSSRARSPHAEGSPAWRREAVVPRGTPPQAWPRPRALEPAAR
jgi:hypothetical protein